MGGIGSGNRSQWSKRDTVEKCKRIDIRYLKRHGLLKNGISSGLSWTCKGKPVGNIGFKVFNEVIKLSFQFRKGIGEWQKIEQEIHFDQTTCNYGGSRKWFKCPDCKRRVSVLCSNGPRFLCRHCCDLTYLSQNERGIDRIISKKHKLGKRIFETYESGRGFWKKKGMHWKTYEKLLVEYKRLDGCYIIGVGKYLEKLESKIN